jgi:hypothetical protein
MGQLGNSQHHPLAAIKSLPRRMQAPDDCSGEGVPFLLQKGAPLGC